MGKKNGKNLFFIDEHFIKVFFVVLIVFLVGLFIVLKQAGYFSTFHCDSSKGGFGAGYIEYNGTYGYKAFGGCGNGGEIGFDYYSYQNGDMVPKKDFIEYYFNAGWLYGSGSFIDTADFYEYFEKYYFNNSRGLITRYTYKDPSTGNTKPNWLLLIVKKDSDLDRFLDDKGFRTFYEWHPTKELQDYVRPLSYRTVPDKYFDNETNYRIYRIYVEQLFEELFNTEDKGFVCNATIKLNYRSEKEHRNFGKYVSVIGKVKGVYCYVPTSSIPGNADIWRNTNGSDYLLRTTILQNFVVFKDEDLARQFGYVPINNNFNGGGSDYNDNNNFNTGNDTNIVGNVVNEDFIDEEDNNGGSSLWLYKFWNVIVSFIKKVLFLN